MLPPPRALYKGSARHDETIVTCGLTIVGFDHYTNSSIIANNHGIMDKTQFKIIEQKVDDLIALCEELQRENRDLKAKEHAWVRERKELLDKNELAKQRVTHMIGRLKSLEQES